VFWGPELSATPLTKMVILDKLVSFVDVLQQTICKVLIEEMLGDDIGHFNGRV
jgi:hypothetical protein